MWMKRRFAQWEVEGQVHERVKRALCECEQARLASKTRHDPDGHMSRRLLGELRASLARVPMLVEAGLLSLRGCLGGGSQPSEKRTSITEFKPDGR
jgi:hypothetical protein